MKTYFYVLPESKKGPIGYGGFETLDAARNAAAEKLLGETYRRADVYSIDPETREISHEFRAELESKVVWLIIRQESA